MKKPKGSIMMMSCLKGECVFIFQWHLQLLLPVLFLAQVKMLWAYCLYFAWPNAHTRMAYEGRILEARNYPKHFLSMVIDGSDNGEYGLPHFARKVTKAASWL